MSGQPPGGAPGWMAQREAMMQDPNQGLAAPNMAPPQQPGMPQLPPPPQGPQEEQIPPNMIRFLIDALKQRSLSPDAPPPTTRYK